MFNKPFVVSQFLPPTHYKENVSNSVIIKGGGQDQSVAIWVGGFLVPTNAQFGS
jgi:hypothetical protein